MGPSKPPFGAQLDRTDRAAQNLNGLWILNEGGGTKPFDLAKGNDGVTDGAWSGTPWGGGLEFDGSNVINMGNIGYRYPQGASPRTIIVWVNRTSNTNMSMFDYGVNTNDKLFLFQIRTGGECLINLFGYNFNIASAGTLSELNRWFQVGVTYDGADFIGYVDGVKQLTHSYVADTGTGRDVRIGPGLVGQLNGAMIKSECLSSADMSQLYCNQYPMFGNAPLSRFFAPAGGFVQYPRGLWGGFNVLKGGMHA